MAAGRESSGAANRQRHRQLEKILQSALELAPERRAEFLLKACEGEDELRVEAEDLLRDAEQASLDTFLERPALAVQEGELQPGTRIAHVRIESAIGRGGMGEVYRGFDEVLQRRVAVKTIRPEKRFSVAAKARFLREARLLSRLEHPGICRVYDFVEGARSDYLILEYVDGRSLGALSSEALSSDEKLRIMEHVARALAQAHGAGIVHRDLKPDNVMVAADGGVKVLDFGIARAIAEPGPSEGSPTPTPTPEVKPVGQHETAIADRPRHSEATFRTDGTKIMGTPRYMSPEQASGGRVAPASDMYSFGVVLYELLSERRAYEGLALQEVLSRVARAELAPLDDQPADVRRLVDDLLSRDPEDRPTAEGVAERLRNLRDKPRRRRRRALAIGAAGLSLAATALITWGVVATRLSQTLLLTAPGETVRLVVLPFLDETRDAQNRWLELGLMEIVAEKLDDLEEVEVVPFRALQPALEAAQEPPTSPESVRRLGRSFGARLVLATQVSLDEELFSAAYRLVGSSGSVAEGEVAARDLTALGDRLTQALAQRFSSEVPPATRFSEDEIANRLYGIGMFHLDSGAAAVAEHYFHVCRDRDHAFDWATLRLAECRQRQGDLQGAVELAEAVRKAARESSDGKLEARALTLLGIVRWQQDDWPHAEALYREAQELAVELGDRRAETDLLNNRAILAWMRGDLDEAEALHREGLSLARKIGYRLAESQLLANLANLASDRGKWTEAEQLYHDSLAIARELGTRVGQMRSLFNLGSLQLTLRRWEDAEVSLQRAFLLAQELGRELERAAIQCQLAAVRLGEGDVEGAAALAVPAWEVLAPRDEFINRVDAAYVMGWLHLARGEAAAASPFLEIAHQEAPQSFQVWLLTARYRALIGDRDGAVRAGDRARQLAGVGWTAQMEDERQGLLRPGSNAADG